MSQIQCILLDALQDRFKYLPEQCSLIQPLFDANGREYLVRYHFMGAKMDGKEGVIASNLPNSVLSPNPNYISTFQARDLSEYGERNKIQKMAVHLDPLKVVIANGDPTLGTPVVWTDSLSNKSYVLGGNGRTIALLLASDAKFSEYLKVVQDRWGINPPPKKKGWRFLWVRSAFRKDGSPLSLDGAVQLAAATQTSTAGAETPLGKALSQSRAYGIYPGSPSEKSLKPLSASPPLNVQGIDRFIKGNSGFWNSLLDIISPTIRSQVEITTPKNAPIRVELINDALVGKYLPLELVEGGFSNEKEEKAVLAILPSLARLHELVLSGQAKAIYDLLPVLNVARIFANKFRKSSYKKALIDYDFQCKQQMGFASIGLGEKDELCELSELGIRLGLFLKRSEGLEDPTKLAPKINKYIDDIVLASHNDPRTVSMFGAAPIAQQEKQAAQEFAKIALTGTIQKELEKIDQSTLFRQSNPKTLTMAQKLIVTKLAIRFQGLEQKTPTQEGLGLFTVKGKKKRSLGGANKGKTLTSQQK